jgi:hypothetical protein
MALVAKENLLLKSDGHEGAVKYFPINSLPKL